MPRAKKRLVPEPHWPSAHAVHTTAYGLGHDAGAAMTALLAQRQDHLTCSVEWYRGFCQGCGAIPDPKVEANIAREALTLRRGLDRVAILLAGIDHGIEGVEEVIGKGSAP